MVDVSVIIPSRNCRFASRTVDDLIEKATGDIEIIIILDGYWPEPPIKDYPNVTILHRSVAQGMRQGINAAVAMAKGKYILKSDDHCMFGQGYDEILKADCDVDWVSVPRRYSLDAENWRCKDKPPIDYYYLSYPDNQGDFGGPGYHGRNWDEMNRRQDLQLVPIDDQMSFQGSCWFMHKDYFHYLELLDHEQYGVFWQEAQEIGLKCWLSGGREIVNKNTWYAHLHKGKQYGRGYFIDKRSLERSVTAIRKVWGNNEWHKQKYNLKWLVHRFWPVPGWPQEWAP